MNTITLSWLLVVADRFLSIANASWLSGNLCWSMPCLNGGSCFGSAFNYLCICPVNYTGASCEKRLGICQENPCGNRGVCIEKNVTTFECRCYLDYIGPTCQEHLPRNLPSIWSTLLPAHTRILFEMLEEAYRARGKERSLVNKEDSLIDFVGLLNSGDSTATPPSPASTASIEITSAANEISLTTSGHALHAHETQYEKTSSDSTTKLSTLDITPSPSIEDSSSADHPTNSISYSDIDMTTTMMTTENNTISSNEIKSNKINQDENIDSSSEEHFTVIFSTSMESADDNHITEDMTTESPTIEITNDIDSHPTTSTEYMDSTIVESDIPNNDIGSMSPSSDPIISSLPIEMTTSSPIAQRQLLYKLCREILSHILPSESADAVATDTAATLSIASNSLPSNNKTADALLSWLSKYVSSPRSTVTSSASSAPTLIVYGSRSSSIPLQRIDMEEALQGLDNES